MTFAISLTELKKSVIVDTETTGLNTTAEIIEIAVIAADTGKVIFNELLWPRGEIDPKAQAVHGISIDELVGKPRYHDIAPRLQGLLAGKTIIGWNIGFDRRLLKQTATQQRCATTWIDHMTTIDIKARYVKQLDIPERLIHLHSTCQSSGIETADLTPHRALADCRLLYRLIHRQA